LRIRARSDDLPDCGGKAGGRAPSFDWLQRTTFALSLYVFAVTPGLNIETADGFDRKSLAFTTVGTSPFVFEVLGMAFVRTQEGPDVEDGPVLNPSPRLAVCCDAAVCPVNRNICMRLMVSTVQEPKSKAKRHLGFGHGLGFGRLVLFPHHSIFSN
jgi:hypothetical protein